MKLIALLTVLVGFVLVGCSPKTETTTDTTTAPSTNAAPAATNAAPAK